MIKLCVAGLVLFLCAKGISVTVQSMVGLTVQTAAYLTGMLNGSLITAMVYRLPKE